MFCSYTLCVLQLSSACDIDTYFELLSEAGLQLYIGEDGSASVTGHTNGGHTVYKPVPMPPS